MKAKIFGAGSMGNHLAQASRRMGWEVVVVDKDTEALRRMKEEIYPARYGAWDSEIELCALENEPKGGFDIIMPATPPEFRMSLAIEALKENPKIIQLEKPICTPDLAGLSEFLEELKKHPETKIINGYEYSISKFAKRAKEILKSDIIGEPQIIEAEIRERWDGILGAHPWLKGPEDTYLGFWKRGGGTTSEHSHGINLWQNFAHTLGLGKIVEVSALMKMAKYGSAEYDESSFMNFTTEKGINGRVIQDLATFPVKCVARVQGSNGFLECIKHYSKDGDLLRYQKNGEELKEEFFPKKRPDDFYEEVMEMKKVLDGEIRAEDSDVSLERGLETQFVIAAAHKSNVEKRTIKIDYEKGYNQNALI